MGRIINIYCDESRQTSERYMILGGIAIPSGLVSKFNESISQCRTQQGMGAEFKWNRVRSRKLEGYKKFLDCFFALNNTGHAHFHCLIIDTNQVDHGRFGSNEEVGFYKFYYQ